RSCFFTPRSPPELYTLSLHDALPICTDRLAKFLTTLGWSNSSPILRMLPEKSHAEIMRRGYDLPHYKIRTHPGREIVRQLAEKRSEEHTSELQSPCNIVCRLLLEKKK